MYVSSVQILHMFVSVHIIVCDPYLDYIHHSLMDTLHFHFPEKITLNLEQMFTLAVFQIVHLCPYTYCFEGMSALTLTILLLRSILEVLR